MIFDHDLLWSFSEHHPGLWDHLAARLPFKDIAERHSGVIERARPGTAAEIMKKDVFCIQEDAPIEEAVTLMADKNIKRLPVLDAEGHFKGMVSRGSVLGAGFTRNKRDPYGSGSRETHHLFQSTRTP